MNGAKSYAIDYNIIIFTIGDEIANRNKENKT